MWEWVRQWMRSNYVRMLEEETVRLRAENRALLNSLLGTVGFPPVETGEAAKLVSMTRVRKRSWPQTQRMMEQSAAKQST